jgi:hypothetical protein
MPREGGGGGSKFFSFGLVTNCDKRVTNGVVGVVGVSKFFFEFVTKCDKLNCDKECVCGSPFDL